MDATPHHDTTQRSWTSCLYKDERDLNQMLELLMQARGMNRVCVSTGVSNAPAIGLYESVGFKIANRYLEYLRPD